MEVRRYVRTPKMYHYTKADKRRLVKQFKIASCICPLAGLGWEVFADEKCKCGMKRAHYHCEGCGGITR